MGIPDINFVYYYYQRFLPVGQNWRILLEEKWYIFKDQQEREPI